MNQFASWQSDTYTGLKNSSDVVFQKTAVEYKGSCWYSGLDFFLIFESPKEVTKTPFSW